MMSSGWSGNAREISEKKTGSNQDVFGTQSSLHVGDDDDDSSVMSNDFGDNETAADAFTSQSWPAPPSTSNGAMQRIPKGGVSSSSSARNDFDRLALFQAREEQQLKQKQQQQQQQQQERKSQPLRIGKNATKQSDGKTLSSPKPKNATVLKSHSANNNTKDNNAQSSLQDHLRTERRRSSAGLVQSPRGGSSSSSCTDSVVSSGSSPGTAQTAGQSSLSDSRKPLGQSPPAAQEEQQQQVQPPSPVEYMADLCREMLEEFLHLHGHDVEHAVEISAEFMAFVSTRKRNQVRQVLLQQATRTQQQPQQPVQPQLQQPVQPQDSDDDDEEEEEDEPQQAQRQAKPRRKSVILVDPEEVGLEVAPPVVTPVRRKLSEASAARSTDSCSTTTTTTTKIVLSKDDADPIDFPHVDWKDSAFNESFASKGSDDMGGDLHNAEDHLAHLPHNNDNNRWPKKSLARANRRAFSAHGDMMRNSVRQLQGLLGAEEDSEDDDNNNNAKRNGRPPLPREESFAFDTHWDGGGFFREASRRDLMFRDDSFVHNRTRMLGTTTTTAAEDIGRSTGKLVLQVEKNSHPGQRGVDAPIAPVQRLVDSTTSPLKRQPKTRQLDLESTTTTPTAAASRQPPRRKSISFAEPEAELGDSSSNRSLRFAAHEGETESVKSASMHGSEADDRDSVSRRSYGSFSTRRGSFLDTVLQEAEIQDLLETVANDYSDESDADEKHQRDALPMVSPKQERRRSLTLETDHAHAAIDKLGASDGALLVTEDLQQFAESWDDFAQSSDRGKGFDSSFNMHSDFDNFKSTDGEQANGFKAKGGADDGFHMNQANNEPPSHDDFFAGEAGFKSKDERRKDGLPDQKVTFDFPSEDGFSVQLKEEGEAFDPNTFFSKNNDGFMTSQEEIKPTESAHDVSFETSEGEPDDSGPASNKQATPGDANDASNPEALETNQGGGGWNRRRRNMPSMHDDCVSDGAVQYSFKHAPGNVPRHPSGIRLEASSCHFGPYRGPRRRPGDYDLDGQQQDDSFNVMSRNESFVRRKKPNKPPKGGGDPKDVQLSTPSSSVRQLPVESSPHSTLQPFPQDHVHSEIGALLQQSDPAKTTRPSQDIPVPAQPQPTSSSSSATLSIDSRQPLGFRAKPLMLDGMDISNLVSTNPTSTGSLGGSVKSAQSSTSLVSASSAASDLQGFLRKLNHQHERVRQRVSRLRNANGMYTNETFRITPSQSADSLTTATLSQVGSTQEETLRSANNNNNNKEW